MNKFKIIKLNNNVLIKKNNAICKVQIPIQMLIIY